MTTSGTYSFSLDNADIITEAFERCGKPPDMIDGVRLRSALRSLNLMLASEWANRGRNLWAVDRYTIPVVAGTQSYALPAGTVALLEGYITDGSGRDIPITPISRAEYTAQPNKALQARPTSFYFERLATPNVFLWPTGETVYSVTFNRFRQLQDAGAGTNTPDAPIRMLEAVVAGLAAKLAVKYAPDRFGLLDGLAKTRWDEASQEDRERVPLRFVPRGR